MNTRTLAVLPFMLAMVVAGCDDGTEEVAEESGWCNTECAACDTEISRTQGAIGIENTGAANYFATMDITWNLCCCNACWPTVWWDDLEDTPTTTSVTWDTGVPTTRPPGAARTQANRVAATKLAGETLPSCP